MPPLCAGKMVRHPALSPPAGQSRYATWAAPGFAATAISAVDAALWDLKAKLLDMPLVSCSGGRERVPIYGSGGFTTYDDAQLREQLAGWVEREAATRSR